MFCKKCNKKGKIGDAYCDNCGSKLEKQTFHLSEKTIRNTIIILIFLLFICTILKIFSYVMSPNYVATEYFKAIIENNTSKIYSYIEENKSDFISEEILKEKMVLFENVDQYKIVNVSKNNNEAIVEFEYVINNQIKTAFVKLNKIKKGVFETWDVESGKKIENITIKVPKGSIITIDEKKIDSYLEINENDYFDYYKIPYMISGEYKIKSVHNDITVEDTLELESNHTYTINQINLNDNLIDSLEKQSLEKLNYLYTNAIQQKNYDEMKEYLNNQLEKSYKNLKRTINQNIIKLNEVNINDIELTKTTYNEEGNLEVTFITDYDINYTYKVDDKEVTTSNKGTSSATLTFIYLDGNYYLSDVVDYPNLKVRW